VEHLGELRLPPRRSGMQKTVDRKLGDWGKRVRTQLGERGRWTKGYLINLLKNHCPKWAEGQGKTLRKPCCLVKRGRTRSHCKTEIGSNG